MTLAEFEQLVYEVAADSPICGIPMLRRLSPSSISLRLDLTIGGFVDAFYNEQTGTTAFAWIYGGRRVFGADNTGGWHVHPLEAPDQHVPLQHVMSFAEFIARIEQGASPTAAR